MLTSGFAKAAMQDGPHAADFENMLSKNYRKAELAARLRAALDGEE